ncbi:FtsX-like permease family protein [Saccharothrix syringae]|uniref:ABC transporter permease n=1 Tax=Saccharothrix syringae TaxID=103733 RepID=A0A5Q0HCE9_SACSY|nr:FtsX-like permease family protein [Saccharothrix syringae]QFZ23634.1 ABC transporter permease [Saccharothrix syringae]
MRRWWSDLALGVRLALGGGRTSWVRLVLTGAGIGIGVAVLLAASSMTTVLAERDARAAATQAVHPEPGRDLDRDRALFQVSWFTEYRGESIAGRFVKAGGPGAPVPPGLPRLPGDGEVFLSPALAELLASPEGAVLRERFPQRVLGTIDRAGLNAPNDLLFYAGDPTVLEEEDNAIVGFGGALRERSLDPVLSLMILVGVVALLFPVLVFVGISTRLAGAERDRRLSALRLVGAGARRVRRIAAGEALLGAFIGLAVGAALFLFGRRFVEDVRLLGISVFVEDLTPSPPLAALIAVLVPVLAVTTAIIAMRRTVVEPLGVVRHAKPVRRVLWWRVLPIFLGSAALLSQSDAMGGERGRASEPVLIAGIVLLLLSIPLMLPWLVERVVGRLRGGAPSWQLAVRRLQLESGTAARVVGGVAVVLAGGIALQSVMASAESRLVDEPVPEVDLSRVEVHLSNAVPGLAEQTVAALERSVGVERVHPTRSVTLRRGAEDYQAVTIGTCEVLRAYAEVPSCRDGDAFFVDGDHTVNGTSPAPRPGAVYTVVRDDPEESGPEWTVPRYVEAKPNNTVMSNRTGLMVTPSVAADLPQADAHASVLVLVDPAQPDVAERVRNALAPLTWRTYASYFGDTGVPQRVEEFRSIRQALLAGSLITLLMAGASLLVLGLEQVRERRRPLAVLAAGGVPRSTLARSLLWQNAVPLLLALVAGVVVGGGLGILLLRVITQPIVLDWAGIAVLSGTAALMVLVVTLLSLPSLHRATGALGLRAE